MNIKSRDSDKYSKANKKIGEIKEELGKVIVGQEEIIDNLLVAILADGNVLLESNPGLGKTKTVETLSKIIGLEFSRIQNTPDLMPSDITGTHIINESGDKTEFVFQEGPIFANIILADEINRATPKTQAALLEAMQEKQVTVGNNTYTLDDPFFIIATQNPLEQEGTYPLPEAQRDRFTLKLKLDYPSEDEEQEIVSRFTESLEYEANLDQIISQPSLIKLQEFTRQMPIAKDIRNYAVSVVKETRSHENLKYGASPRASINLVNTAKAKAVVEGRNHVSVEDVENMAVPVLRHRIGLSFEAEKKGKTKEEIIKSIVNES